MTNGDEMIRQIGRLKAEPVGALKAVVRLQTLLDEEALAQVGRARRAGVSWKDIASALGVTRQAVHKKFAWMV